MKNRKVIIEFETPAGTKRLDGIECRFQVEKMASAMMNKATVDICNLTADDIKYLTSYTSEWMAVQQHKRIRIWAGYEDDGVALIFDGDITEAKPTGIEDQWLNCKAMSGYYNNKQLISTTIQGEQTIQQICNEVASSLGLVLNFQAQQTKKIKNFSYTGDKTKIIKELNLLGDIIAYEDDGVLYVIDQGQPRQDVGIRIINENSGMIGNPEPNAMGVELKVLLDNTLKINQQIRLESKSIPAANGDYFIYELIHEGDLRGNDFYSKIKCRTFNSSASGSILGNINIKGLI